MESLQRIHCMKNPFLPYNAEDFCTVYSPFEFSFDFMDVMKILCIVSSYSYIFYAFERDNWAILQKFCSKCLLCMRIIIIIVILCFIFCWSKFGLIPYKIMVLSTQSNNFCFCEFEQFLMWQIYSIFINFSLYELTRQSTFIVSNTAAEAFESMSVCMCLLAFTNFLQVTKLVNI